ncbi:anhydro-N-acetylmuramic acid kinase AnmK [Bacillus sp. AFS017336]|uniref:anhydro-N-acetylmuramic acid kinase AnmK n=1 Tax=Bacillus sp. AFS017336 TaxID=2033489 RepID=UPI000BEF6318|nr:anhydro-N-acetylmuramic acid kinase AnmK [Bacillus sp. AFS017336]PEL12306.1 anhydro-N-acetylmuramic acid kinase [Bacillus sp. AFS017336]
MVYAVGLMSGTSLDGIDSALVEITGYGSDTEVKLIDFMTIPLEEALLKEIEDAITLVSSNAQHLCSLNFKLGYAFADAVKQICSKNQFPLNKLDFIGSHGQTIYHQPEVEANFVQSTLQLGESAVIAYETNTKVVSNFRVMDMAAGGYGAPLVPHSELLLYRSKTKTRLLQNIGGIGNVTIVPKNATIDDLVAFDTGPGNMIIDEICKRYFNVPFDASGELAAKGNVNERLLERCMSIPYILAPIPKTTGRELFGTQFVDEILVEFSDVSPIDFITTMTMFTAKSIAENYKKFILPNHPIDEVIVGGGGSHNKTLLHMLQELLGEHSKVLVQEDIGFSSDAKEAIAFAILANETLNGLPSNVPGATKANRLVILGNITPKPY